MADNQETFSFDASGAIAELGRLDKAVDTVNQSVSQFNVTAAGTQKVNLFAGAQKDLDAYIRKLRKGMATGNAAINTQKAKVQDLGLSWKSVGKLIAGDLIRRGIFQVRDAFFEAADAAEEFQLQVARIDAITDNLNFDQIEEQILGLSSALARPVDEVGAALFEAFQNELGDTKETLDIVSGAANDLALITGGDLVQAVNAISSAIKGYNLDIDAAGETAAIFFNAIDNGRVTLDELEGSLGKVAGLGRAAGVDLQNLSAAVATITLSGTDANVAFTQLRNVLNKAIKPTKELRGALNELQVSSFNQLVEKSGNLRNALQAIFDQLGRDPERFAKAFNTIRGQLGAINILLEDGTDGASEFNRILAEGEGAAEKLAAGLKGIRDTDAFKSQQQAAEFNRILTELGEGALKAKVALQGLLLGFIGDANGAAAAIAGLTTAVVGYGLAWALIPATIVGAFPIAAAIAFGAVLGIQASKGIDIIKAKIVTIADDLGLIEVAAQNLKLVKETETKRITDLNEELGDTEDALLGVSDEAQRAFNEIKFGAEVAGEAVSEIFSDAVQVFADGQTQLLSDVEKAINDVENKFQNAASNLADAQQELEEFDFNRSLEGVTEGTKAAKLQTRAWQQLAKIRKAGIELDQGTGTREELENAIKLGKQYAKANTQNQRRLKNQFGINKAQDIERKVLAESVKEGVKLRNTLNETRGKNLREDFLEAAKASAELREDSKEIEALFSTTKLDGTAKSVKEVNDDLETAKKKVAEFKKSGDAFKGLQIFDDLDLEAQAARSVDQFGNALSKTQVDWKLIVSGLQDALNGEKFTAEVTLLDKAAEGSGNAQLDAAVSEAAAGAGSPAEQAGAVNQAVNEIIRTQEELNSAIKTGEANFQFLKESVEATVRQTGGLSLSNLFSGKESQAIQGIFAGVAEQIGTVNSEGIRDLEIQTNAALQRLKAANENGIISDERFQQLDTLGKTLYSSLTQQAINFENKSKFNQGLLDDTKEFKEELQEADDVTIEPEVDLAPVKELTGSVKETAVAGQVASTKVEAIGPAASRGIAPASSLASTVGTIGTAADNSKASVDALISRLNVAIDKQSQLNSGGGDVSVYRGGQVNYRAAGGTGRGQDTIPANLAPEEFVVNSQASRNFFSQLQAINAGSTSAGAPGGDSNTTINVGDVNVNSSSQLPTQTAREVGQSIQREIRRRTFKL